MTLKSRSELLQEQSKTMDLMDVNQVLEVPDTPDRQQVSATHDSNFNERQNNASTNNQKPSKDYINGRMRNQQIENGKSVTVSGNRRLFIHPYSSTSFEHPKPSVDTTRHDKGKGKSLCNSDVQKLTHQEGGSFVGVSKQNGIGHSGISRVNAFTKGVLPLNRIPAVESLDRSSKSCKVDNTFKNVAHHKAESSIQPSSSIKVPHKRMLVRNGCISPHNIAKSKHIEKKDETGIVVKEGENGSISNTVDIKDMVTEDKDSHRCKGKGVSVSHSHHPLKELDRKTIHKEQSIESERWRTTHNHRKQRDIEQQKKGLMQRDHRNEKDFVNLDESKIVSSSSSSVSTSRNLGKRSVSLVDDFNGETSNSRPKRNKNLNGVGPSNPVVEPITCNNEDSSVRALQVEADEMLARELQQQLYNEELTSVLEVNEMDSNLPFAMPAQQDNSTRQAGGRRPYRRQAPLSLNVRQPNTSRPSSIQRRLQPQARASSRMSQLRTRFQTINRRNSIFPPNMDVDVRMQILEMLEADGDRRRRNDVSRIRREFNEDDYEMLLALDDDNHRHGGATPAQINNLPESTVQAENLQECSICLETPAIGETIRHLPCLHRFHKECIDQWLRRKTSCPICKSSIA
ncbi:hypothetical protein Lser_V15G02785 [Lactuca serriola]